jgi:hypothetical protein
VPLKSPHEGGKRGADNRKSQKPEHVDISRLEENKAAKRNMAAFLFGQMGGTADGA